MHKYGVHSMGYIELHLFPPLSCQLAVCIEVKLIRASTARYETIHLTTVQACFRSTSKPHNLDGIITESIPERGAFSLDASFDFALACSASLSPKNRGSGSAKPPPPPPKENKRKHTHTQRKKHKNLSRRERGMVDRDEASL